MFWLERKIIEKYEAMFIEPADHMRRILAAGRSAFWKFILVIPLSGHRKCTPKTLNHLARVASTHAQDCGRCLRIVLRFALKEGVDSGKLQALLDGETDKLEPVERAAIALGRLVSIHEPMAKSDRALLVKAVGENGVTELALAAASNMVYPALKRGLGPAYSCALEPIRVKAFA